MINEKQSSILGIIMAAVLLVSMFFVAREGAACVMSGDVVMKKQQKHRVVIDAGHGGDDPGKVGIDGSLEKDINLSIAFRLKYFLEAQDVEVIMTRSDEKGLYREGESNKKIQDMKRRVEVIEDAQADLVISIHQNSYPEEEVRGAQMFYYESSKESRLLAELLQSRFRSTVDAGNHREAKGNTSYYLLKKTSCPIVIVECGFLSNREEAALLKEAQYQERVAWAIHMGVLQFLNSRNRG